MTSLFRFRIGVTAGRPAGLLGPLVDQRHLAGQHEAFDVDDDQHG